ncbi:MAG TPA: hypothetical protein VEC57_15085 [Candidatus Limnocylindrales bacterium]|nr:hypothetical protein [Candidatus Limnocylindrales bacterium]
MPARALVVLLAMLTPFPAFVGGAYASQSPVSANEALVNWYVEQIESAGATSRWALYPTPGFRARREFPTSVGRAAFAENGRVFVIFGNTLYEVYEDWSFEARGGMTLAVDDNPATICSNGSGGQQLFITSGDKGYCYDLVGNTLTEELSSGATMGGYAASFFLAFDRTNARIRTSAAFDGTSWDPTDIAERTSGADDWQAMLVNPYGYVFLPGSKTSEFWYAVGGAGFPFAVDPSGLAEEGIAAPFSLQQAGKSVVWLATNANGGYQVMRASGFTPERISDHALEFALSTYGDVSNAIGETYEDRGHAFYLLTIPGARVTWAYDFTTQRWAQRGTWIAADNAYTYLRPTFHCFGFHKHLMADRESNVLYEMSHAFATDVDDRPIRRLRRTPALTNQHTRLFFDTLEILFQTGIGVADGEDQDVDPQVMLRVSNDFGQTWGHEHTASAGKIGEFWRRVRFWNLGSGRGRVYEVVVSAAVPWRITDAYQQVRGSREGA